MVDSVDCKLAGPVAAKQACAEMIPFVFVQPKDIIPEVVCNGGWWLKQTIEHKNVNLNKLDVIQVMLPMNTIFQNMHLNNFVW